MEEDLRWGVLLQDPGISGTSNYREMMTFNDLEEQSCNIIPQVCEDAKKVDFVEEQSKLNKFFNGILDRISVEHWVIDMRSLYLAEKVHLFLKKGRKLKPYVNTEKELTSLILWGNALNDEKIDK